MAIFILSAAKKLIFKNPKGERLPCWVHRYND